MSAKPSSVSPVPSSSRLAAAAALAAAALFLTMPTMVDAQDAGAEWRNTTEFTLVLTGGNSESSTLGLRNSLRRAADNGEFRLNAATLRTEATRIERVAVETAGGFDVREESDTERTAERYSVGARYDRTISESSFGYVSSDWSRNTFAGFDSRTILSGGAGLKRTRPDRYETKLGAGLTYTFQSDVTPDPDRSDSFAGLRMTLDHVQQLTTGTSFELAWVVDANAQEWDDVRGDLRQSITAALSDRLALKTTLELAVDNDPPLESLRLQTADGQDTGQTVLSPLRRVDRNLSVALVVTL